MLIFYITIMMLRPELIIYWLVVIPVKSVHHPVHLKALASALLAVHQRAYQLAHRLVCPLALLAVRLSVPRPVLLPAVRSVLLAVHQSVRQPAYQSRHRLVHLSANQLVHLSVHQSPPVHQLNYHIIIYSIGQLGRGR